MQSNPCLASLPFTSPPTCNRVYIMARMYSRVQRKPIPVLFQAQHNPLVIIPGGPGLPHDYLETLEGAAKDDRLVVLFDPIGTGNSTALPADVVANAPYLLGTSSLVEQVI